MGNLPILTEFAMQIASGRGDGKRAGGREKMIERFFLHRIHVNGTGIAVDQGMINPLPILPDLTIPSQARADLALTGTEGALNAVLPHGQIIGRWLGTNEPLTEFLGPSRFGKQTLTEQGRPPAATDQEAALDASP